MAEYKVIRTCYWNNTLFREGQIVDIKGDTPPDHFMLISEAPKEEKEEEKEATEFSPRPQGEPSPDNTVTELRAKLDEAGIPYDRRWGAERLEHELHQGKRLQGKVERVKWPPRSP